MGMVLTDALAYGERLFGGLVGMPAW